MNETNFSVIILIAIPILGAIKNVVKRKSFNIKIFLRTFIVYFTIYLFFKIFKLYSFNLDCFNSMLLSLTERWSMFIYKIIYSYITKNYEKKKLKYYQKYNLELSSGTLKDLELDLELEKKEI